MSKTNIVLACQGLQKIYRQGTRAAFEVPVLMGVDMEIMAGERVAVVARPAPARARCCICSAGSTRRPLGPSS